MWGKVHNNVILKQNYDTKNKQKNQKKNYEFLMNEIAQNNFKIIKLGECAHIWLKTCNLIHTWSHHANNCYQFVYLKKFKKRKGASWSNTHSHAFQGEKSRKWKSITQHMLNVIMLLMSVSPCFVTYVFSIKVIKHIDFDESISTHVDHTHHSPT